MPFIFSFFVFYLCFWIEYMKCSWDFTHSYALFYFFFYQNPRNCSQAKYLICTAGNSGLGSITHIINTCFLFALGTNRSMLINYGVLRYKGLERVFRPLSSTCVGRDTSKAEYWKGKLFSNFFPIRSSKNVRNQSSLFYQHSKTKHKHRQQRKPSQTFSFALILINLIKQSL